MSYDGTLKFDTKVDQGGFEQGMSTLKSTALKALSAIGIAISAGAAAQSMIALGKESITLASNLAEVQNVIDVTFGDGAAKVNAFAKNAVTAYGLSELSAKKYTGTMGAMLKSMGLSSSAVESMSTSMTGLAGDFASFYNITSEEAFEKIRAGIAGETEPLRQLGINMSVANLEAYALSQGINTAYASMTQAEQATLRYNYLMSVSADAQGDFTRTSSSYANSQRLATLATDELKTAIGNRLLPVATKLQQGFAEISSAAANALNERGVAGVVDVITNRFPVATAAVSGLAAAFGALLVIQTLTPLVKAFQEAQLSLALAMMGSTTATLLETGALTAKEIIVGALTGKIGLATAAQTLFNMAIAANPVMLLVTAIGLLVGGVVLLAKNFDTLYPEITQTREELKALNKEVEESARTFEDSIDAAEKQRSKYDGLIDTLADLSAAYSGSSIEQAQMQTICNTLNGSVDGLNVTFDAQTGALSQTTQAMHDLVSAQYEAARSCAALQRYEEVLGEQIDAEFERRKAYAEWSKYYDTSTGDMLPSATYGSELFAAWAAKDNLRKADKTLAETTENTKLYGDYLAELGVTYDDVATSADGAAESTAGLGESLDGAAAAEARVVVAGIDVSDVLDKTGMSADDAAERLSSFSGAATNMFERISTKSRVTVSQMIANLTSNTMTMEKWGANIAVLGEKLPVDLLQPLIDQGPEEMAGVIDMLANTSDEELAKLVAAFESGGDAAKKAWLLSIGAGTTTPEVPHFEATYTPKYGVTGLPIPQYGVTGLPLKPIASAIEADTSLSDAAAQAVTSAKAAMDSAVETAGFPEIADEIVNAIAEEITGAKQLFFDAGQDLALSLSSGFMGHEPALIAEARQLAIAVSRAFYDNLDFTFPPVNYVNPKYGVTGIPITGIPSTAGGGTTGGGTTGGLTGSTIAPSIAKIVSLSTARDLIRASSVGAVGKVNNGIEGGVHIEVAGVVENDVQLGKRLTREFEEVMYGRNS